MLFACLLLLPLAAPAPPANPLIVPGHSLGNVILGTPVTALASLGRSNTGDAGMQHSWATWYSKAPHEPHTQLDMYGQVEYGKAQASILVVRATSPFFHTSRGLRAGATLASARQEYGPLVLAATYQAGAKIGPRYIYDNARAGLAVETDGPSAASHCTAVLVHLPGKDLKTNYVSMADYLQQLAQGPAQP